MDARREEPERIERELDALLDVEESNGGRPASRAHREHGLVERLALRGDERAFEVQSDGLEDLEQVRGELIVGAGCDRCVARGT